MIIMEISTWSQQQKPEEEFIRQASAHYGLFLSSSLYVMYLFYLQYASFPPSLPLAKL